MNYNPEKIIYYESCHSGFLRFWLKTKFTITNKRLQIKSKNAILGILPIGYSLENLNYRNISTVQSSSKLHVIKFLLGLWLFSSSFRLLLSPEFITLGILEFILGFFLLSHSFKVKLKITNNSGKSTEVKVSFLESRKIQKIAEEINNQVNYH